MVMDIENRKVIFRALFGSHNYNLNTETSDEDWKVYTAPNFDDLYYSKVFSKVFLGQDMDLDVHDIRTIPKAFWHASINFIEILFSEKIIFGDDISNDTKLRLQILFDNRQAIAKMNLPYLYEACIGTHIEQKKKLNRPTSKTQHLFDLYGYDTKSALHSLRVLEFLRKFADSGFSDFKGSIWHENDSSARDWLLDIKHGGYTKEAFLAMADNQLNIISSLYKDKYRMQPPNEELNQFVIDLIKGIVANEAF